MTNVVFLPGVNNSASGWQPIIDALGSDLTAQAINCPPLESVDEIAEALLTELPERFVVVGHSFGGYVALAMLANAPERLQSVVLINSSDGSDSPAGAENRVAKAAEAAAGNYERLANAASVRAYHPRNNGNEQLASDRATGIAEYGVQRYVAHQRASAVRPDRAAVLASSSVPVLVIAADADQVIAPERQRAMALRAGTRFVTVENTGHMLPAEEPRAVADLIAAWIGSGFSLPNQVSNTEVE